MVELQIINKILTENSLGLTVSRGITSDYFTTYRAEYDFILGHNEKYGQVPDALTMGSQFKDFDFVQVNEADQYLLEKLAEQYTFKMVVPIVQKSADMLQTDSIEAVRYLKSKIEPLLNIGKFGLGKNIIKTAMERWDEYIKRKSVNGLLGITTGMPEMDEILHGWLPGEELVTIVGRTNEGKSWIMIYFLVMAWKAGKKVLLYSGEMSSLIVGFRFDTLHENFSNSGMMNGGEQLGTSTDSRSEGDYQTYIDGLAKMDVPFIVVTPKDFGGRRPTVQDLNMLIEKYKPDIVGVDQLSLMEDHRQRKGDPNRILLSHITEDLFLSSEKYGIPILADAQANRKAAQSTKKDQGAENTPELDEIGEADAIGQNSSRVISIKQTSAGLKMAIKKNRYGINNREFLYFWDIDTGRFQFIHNSQYESAGEDEEGLTDGTEVF